MSKYLMLLAAAMMLLAVGLFFRINKLEKENKILVNNNKSLTQRVEVYKTRSGKTATKTIVMQSTKSNLTDQQTSLIKDAKLRVKDVSTIGNIETEIDTSVVTPLKSAIRDTCLNFIVNDEFTASVCIKSDTAIYHPLIRNRQDIIFSNSRVYVNQRKKFFLARWLQKRQTVVTAVVINSNKAISTVNQSFTYVVK